MLPDGPGGMTEYSMPGDLYILSGHCSYIVLQQADRSRKVLMMVTFTADNADMYRKSSFGVSVDVSVVMVCWYCHTDGEGTDRYAVVVVC